nr:glycosyltransferase [Microbacterium esteraromaticum]
MKAVVYVGGISSGRGAEVMVAAATEPTFPEGWRLTLAGAIPAQLQAELEVHQGAEHTDFLGQIPPLEARDLLLNARVGLVVLQDTPAYRDSLPTKMFEYFAAGVPVVASDFPLWRDIVTQHECGILVDPSSPAKIAEAIRRYADDPQLLACHSRNARRLAIEQLNWASEAQVLRDTYSRIAQL